MIYKGKNTIILGLFIVLSINSLFAQEFPTKKPFKIPAKTTSSVKNTNTNSNNKSKNLQGETQKPPDTITKSVNKTITDIIPHSAEDYIKMDRKANKMYLYNKAKITYGDIDIEAGLIIIDFKNNEIYATGIKDSLGNLTQRPVFVQAGSKSTHDEMRVNYKTKKALLHNSVSEMDGNKELKYRLAISKKENDSVIFAKDAIITTSEDIYNPEYVIHIHKMKLIPNKKIIAGYSHLVIENVPTPLGIPFAFFPITDTKTSGILMPVWGENKYGYFLQNGGYYFAISDYIDLALQGSIYMNGSYGVKVNSNYKKRYRYSGNFGFSYDILIENERGLPNYLKSKAYDIHWTHTPDRKSSPNSSFSTSVNYTSSNFYRDNVDINYNALQTNNTSSSNITYTKAFVGTPFNLTASSRISQNFNTELVNLTLPSVRVSMQQIFPLAKLVKGKNLLSNMSLSYDFNSQNNITTDQSHFFKSGMMDKAKSSIVHTSGISTNLTALKYFRFTLGGDYREVWNLQTVHKSWDNVVNDVKKDTIKGFDAFRTYSFDASVNTTFYGLFRFKEGKRIQAIRHSVNPSISFSTAPKFDQYYEEYQASIDPTDIKDYTRFEYVGSGTPSLNESRYLSFNISNQLEAKINKKDSLHPDAKPEKRMLLRNFNFSTRYDMVKDTMKWSPLSISTTIPLMNSKMNVNLRSTYSFYAKNASGNEVNISNRKAGGSLLRFQYLEITTSYSFSNKKKDKQSNSLDKKTSKKKKTEEEVYYNFKIPWTCNMGYTFIMNDLGITRNIISFNGSVDLTPKWHIRYSSSYDIKDKGFGFTNFNIDRDLDSWTMHFNWTPKGQYNSWGFFIGIKSSVLSDIKWDKRSP